jgi:hypothetical protein
MTRIITLVTAVLAIATMSACQKQESGGSTSAGSSAASTAGKMYDCPMHPEVVQSTPGKCPKCGMSLVEVKTTPAGDHDHADHDHDYGPGARPHADHNPKHGGMLGMQGDYHVEIVARHGGDLQVYIYDAYTQPLAVTGGTGRIRLEMPDGAGEVSVPLSTDAGATRFEGNSPDADRAVAATIEVTLPDTSLSMSFPLQATLTGEIVDIDCLARLGEAGRGSIHAECARECIRNGMPVGLSVGKTIYMVTLAGDGTDRSANERLAEYAGRQVEVTGRVRESNGFKVFELADVKPAAGS